MNSFSLINKSLAYYWRTNLAVVLGVATAVAVLGGALLVGDSVRGSQRDLVIRQLGRTDQVVVSTGFFREALADELRADEGFATSFTGICPLVVVQGSVTDQTTNRRVLRVTVYGVDERFWSFHGIAGRSGDSGLNRDALVSPALASEIGVASPWSPSVRSSRCSGVTAPDPEGHSQCSRLDRMQEHGTRASVMIFSRAM